MSKKLLVRAMNISYYWYRKVVLEMYLLPLILKSGESTDGSNKTKRDRNNNRWAKNADVQLAHELHKRDGPYSFLYNLGYRQNAFVVGFF